MKKIAVFLTCLVIVSACSKDDSPEVIVNVSQSALMFTPSGSEQIIQVSANTKWDCEYNADWLLVRQQQESIRVIVNDNTTTSVRSDVIRITAYGEVRAEIQVTQEGATLSLLLDPLSAVSQGGILTIPIQSNLDWKPESDAEWCDVQKNGENLLLTISRNYSMTERTCLVTVKAGALAQQLSLTQAGCEWFESFEMIPVEGGTFLMGAQKTDNDAPGYDISAYAIEQPVHSVTVGNFLIGKFEVTQEQWMAAMSGENPSTMQGEHLPVETVSWDQVQAFISILNEKSGLHYRLPTEAEWEFAARGGNKSEGYNYSGHSVLGACAWYYSNSEGSTHEVGGKEENELGICDMSGNVREWCNDWFSYYSTDEVMNPVGPESGVTKMNRGGSWTTPAVNCRNTYRHTDYPNEAAQDLGFRLVLVE